MYDLRYVGFSYDDHSAREKTLEALLALPDLSLWYDYPGSKKGKNNVPVKEIAEIYTKGGHFIVAYVAGTFKKELVYAHSKKDTIHDSVIEPSRISTISLESIAHYDPLFSRDDWEERRKKKGKVEE